MVSEIFDSKCWKPVDGFDFTDITYHRAVDQGTVRVAFDRPDVRNAFRPHTVDELFTALDHARRTSDVGCVLITGNGPSPKDGVYSFCAGGDQKVRGHAGYVDDSGQARLNVLELQRIIRTMPKPVIALVAGYAIGRLGRIPEAGERVAIGSAELEILETQEQRVTELELHQASPARRERKTEDE